MLSGLRLAAALLCCAGLMPAPVRAQTVDGGRYGPVRFQSPAGSTRGYVVLFSDLGGWTAADDAALRTLVEDGAMVVGVDTPRYLANIAAGTRDCDQLVGDAEGLSRQLQRRFGHEAYWFPILAGVGAGGTLAWVTLSEAPGNTLSGAVSIDPSAVLPGPRPLCPGASSRPADGGFEYQPIRTLAGFWAAGITARASIGTVVHLQQLANRGTPVGIHSLTGQPLDALTQLVAENLHAESAGGVRALPIVAMPVARPARAMAVVLSGDGGWRDLDKTIAGYLQADGMPVIGWDCVRYFWRRRSPAQAARDLELVLTDYMQRWNVQEVVLIGYSFGADVLPSMYNLLPPALQSHVVLLSLLGLDAKADWEIRVTGWLGAAPSPDATLTAPELARIPPRLVQCFYGSEETRSACPALAASGAEAVQLSGGHHFGQDYRGIERRILSAVRAREASRH